MDSTNEVPDCWELAVGSWDGTNRGQKRRFFLFTLCRLRHHSPSQAEHTSPTAGQLCAARIFDDLAAQRFDNDIDIRRRRLIDAGALNNSNVVIILFTINRSTRVLRVRVGQVLSVTDAEITKAVSVKVGEVEALALRRARNKARTGLDDEVGTIKHA